MAEHASGTAGEVHPPAIGLEAAGMTSQKSAAGGARKATALARSRWSDRVLEDRVHRTLYTDPAVFQEELVKVFGGRSWAR